MEKVYGVCSGRVPECVSITIPFARTAPEIEANTECRRQSFTQTQNSHFAIIFFQVLTFMSFCLHV